MYGCCGDVGTCVGAQRANGARCTEDKQCWENNCVGGYCKPDCASGWYSCGGGDIDAVKGLPANHENYVGNGKWKNPDTGKIESLYCLSSIW